MKKDLLSIADLTAEEIVALLDVAARLKADRQAGVRPRRWPARRWRCCS